LSTEGERLDDATAFLTDRFGDRATEVMPLGRGFWSRAYSFRLDGRDMVVRFAVERRGYEKDSIARALVGRHLPVPEMVEIGELEDVGYYAITVRHHGRFLEDLAPSTASWLAPALWEVLDSLREAPVPPSAGAGWYRADEPEGRTWQQAMTLPFSPFAPEVADLGQRLKAWPEVADLAERAGRAIGSVVAGGCCPEVRHLLHADLLTQNLLDDERSRTVAAVLDWGQMAYGDFVFDVAALAFHAPWAPAVAALDLHRSAARHFQAIGLDVPDLAMRLHCYELRVGLDRILSAAASRWWDLLRPPSCAGAGSGSIAEVAARTAAILDAGPPAL
jgi:aminoglycoside phosphotransferase (APT) family kinase protein